MEDVSLSTPTTFHLPLSAKHALQFLAVVEIDRIPLSLTAGPPLDVWTGSSDTNDWFTGQLVEGTRCQEDEDSEHEWWRWAVRQSPLGILTKVIAPCEGSSGIRVTELLFYAATTGGSAVTGLPSPPSSSPAEADGQQQPSLRVHALPLSSDILRQADNIPTPVSIAEPHFLPPASNTDTPVVHNIQSAVKRKSVSTLFDEATEQRRATKRRGGESASAFASKHEQGIKPLSHRRSLSIDTKQHVALNAPSPLAQTSRLRSPSLPSDSRPGSRKGAEGQQRPSSLSRVASVNEPESNPVEDRNKELISRMVMAGMRMHGLQRKKKGAKSSKTSVDDEQQAALDAAADEEYKLVYHQVFKGAAFAFVSLSPPYHIHLEEQRSNEPQRRQIASQTLAPATIALQDTVDKLLDLFCQDPCTAATNPAPTTTSALEADARPQAACTTPSDQRLAGSRAHADPAAQEVG